MKLLKGVLLVLAILLVGAVILAATAHHLLRGTPRYYRSYSWDPVDRGIINQQFVDKLSLTHNLAFGAAAEETRLQRGTQREKPSAPRTLTLTFTEEEINAFLAHHADLLKPELDPYIANPGIFLREGQLILAAEARELGFVVSLQFEPRLDEQDRLRLRLSRCLGGRLPLPRMVMGTQIERIRGALAGRLPEWQRNARMKPEGYTNGEAVKAWLGKLLLGALNDEPMAPVLFMPDGRNAVPLRVMELRVQDQSLSLTLQPMSPDQREQVFRQIRAPVAAITAE